MSRPDSARFIWYDTDGHGRNRYGMFRKTFDLTEPPRSAVLHLFADTHYQLFVNGQFVEYGPVRFDPRFPQFDTHDITDRLVAGPNVIAVLANHFGMKTFKAIPVRGGLIARGQVEGTDGAVVDLTTAAGAWRCAESKAHTYAPKLSFALNATERYDQSREEPGWTAPSFDDSTWRPCVELDDQSGWGTLEPRGIPFMSGDEVPVHAVRSVLPLARREHWYSFGVPAPNLAEIHAGDGPHYLAFSTWVYSPCDQIIHAGVFWSDSWLNGRMLPRGTESIDKPMRYSQPWELRTGWNHYGGVIKVYWDIVEHYIALPPDKGLIVSADRNPDSPALFHRSDIFNTRQFDGAWPYAPDDPLEAAGGWTEVPRDQTAQSPCRETGWDDYGEPVEYPTASLCAGHVFRKTDYPHGFAVLLDIDHMHLAFPRLSLRGVRGATVDLTYSEHLMADHRHLRHTHNYSAGDRVLCTRDELDYVPCHPRGMRYVKITVRNAAGDVTLDRFSLRSARYPVEYRGRFHCSDNAFNAIWEMGRRTQHANMEDAYVDCSGRERGMYLRDTIIQYHVNLAAFGDQALMGRCMQLYGQSPDSTRKFRAVYPNAGDYTIADFALNGLEGYLAYYQYSGNVARIRTDWGAMMGNLQWFHELADQRDDLLLDADWDTKQGIKAHYGGFHGDLHIVEGHMDNSGIHCVFSCTYLLALQAAAVLGKAIGADRDVAEIERRIAVLSRSIPQTFWDPDTRSFADNLERTTHSVHASLFAVRAGIVSPEQLDGIRAHVTRELRSVFVNGYDPSAGTLTSPNFAFYILDGLYRAGLTRVAEELIRTGWGWALAQGLRTCPEYWSLHASLCHAWSASPTWYLSKHVLGVQYPKAPDLSEVEIRVQTESVTEAQGALPHPSGGEVEVKWHMENGKRVFDYVKAPEGVVVRVAQ